MISKKRPAVDDLEIFQPIQIAAKDEKVCSGKNTKGVVGQKFVKEIGHVIYGSNQPSQQKPGAERGSSRKDLWRILMSNGSDSCEFHLKTDTFLRILYQQKHRHPGLREAERRIPCKDRDTQGKCHVKMEAEIGVMHLQAK